MAELLAEAPAPAPNIGTTHATPLIALVGNPNAGKSALFNALTGARQKVGNYPGVTVERHTGRWALADGRPVELLDLPGAYSLDPSSPDEAVTRDVVTGRGKFERTPDALVVVVDAGNLDLHLRFTLQLLALGGPMVVALNMVDLAARDGLTLDAGVLARELGVPVVETVAVRRRGLDPLREAITQALASPAPQPLPPQEMRTLQRRARQIALATTVREDPVRRWAQAFDNIALHPVWGGLLLLAVLFTMFQAVFSWAQGPTDLIDGGVTALQGWLSATLPPGFVRSLLTDGVLAGVGAVVVFLPQILILFAFILVLEASGYMVRAAFLMDRLMSRCGLSGKSFIPLLSSVACAVPGIMAARVIENRRDRFATVLVAPLMSCSARLPVYVLMIAAFLTDGYAWWVPGLVLFAMYMLGFTLAPVVALLLKRSLLRGATPVFVMELPAYKRPTVRGVARRMFDAGTAFVRRAGTVILAAMILIWASLYFPHADATGTLYEDRLVSAEARIDEAKEAAKEADDAGLEVPEAAAAVEEARAARNAINGEWKRNSVMGQVGRALEPAFTPLGWDWRIGTAAVASFPAREVIVGMLGLVYDTEGGTEDGTGLRDAVRKEWAADPVRGKYGAAVALSVMVFVALCLQCVSTLAVIRRETQSWAWPAFAFAYMTALAYAGAFVTFQVGRVVTDALA